MKLRYKSNQEETYSDSFNMSSISEVLTPDDSVYPKDMEVFLENKQEWKCMSEAFKDNDLIPDNYNTSFREPKNEEERTRGYY